MWAGLVPNTLCSQTIVLSNQAGNRMILYFIIPYEMIIANDQCKLHCNWSNTKYVVIVTFIFWSWQDLSTFVCLAIRYQILLIYF